ncbi:hypothetical protein DsansV1_C08g0081241 [Dioscorea sansibarensis]
MIKASHLENPLTHNYGAVPKRSRTRPLTWLFGIFCTLLSSAIIVAGLTVLIIYLIFRPRSPHLFISSATLNAGHIDTDMGIFLNADLTILANFSNPNHKVNIFFSYIELDLYFNDTLIATQSIPGFSERAGETVLRSVHMVTSEVVMREVDALRWWKQVNENKIALEVRGRFRTRSDFGSLLHFTYWLYSHCSIALSDPPGGVLLSCSCRTKRKDF